MRGENGPFVLTVAYVRSLRIGSLTAYCQGKPEGAWPCCHQGRVDLTGMHDGQPLEEIARRLMCTACGAIGALDARPDWSEMPRSDQRPNWIAGR